MSGKSRWTSFVFSKERKVKKKEDAGANHVSQFTRSSKYAPKNPIVCKYSVAVCATTRLQCKEELALHVQFCWFCYPVRPALPAGISALLHSVSSCTSDSDSPVSFRIGKVLGEYVKVQFIKNARRATLL